MDFDYVDELVVRVSADIADDIGPDGRMTVCSLYRQTLLVQNRDLAVELLFAFCPRLAPKRVLKS